MMKKILIIEDDKAIAAIERDYLVSFSYEVETVHDGFSGLQRGLSGEFDLILLDLLAPPKNHQVRCHKFVYLLIQR